VIYLDSSVVLARLLTEPRNGPDAAWNNALISSRLLEYEVWNRIHARDLTRSLGETAQSLLEHIELIEMTQTVLARATKPFPITVRTLDALHLATIEFVRAEGRAVQLASFDRRMIAAARALGIELCDF
jgi:predicted nucleic acid-binding protein